MTITYVDRSRVPTTFETTKQNKTIVTVTESERTAEVNMRNESTHAQGAQDVMKQPGASSCPIQEIASPVRQPDLRLQSVMQAWI
jgi:hypothetical protein